MFPSYTLPNYNYGSYNVVNDMGQNSSVKPTGFMQNYYYFYFFEFNPNEFGTNSWYPYGVTESGQINFSLVHSHGEGQDALHGFLELFGLDKWTVDGGLSFYNGIPGSSHYYHDIFGEADYNPSSGYDGMFSDFSEGTSYEQTYSFLHAMHQSQHQTNLSSWNDFWRSDTAFTNSYDMLIMSIRAYSQIPDGYWEF